MTSTDLKIVEFLGVVYSIPFLKAAIATAAKTELAADAVYSPDAFPEFLPDEYRLKLDCPVVTIVNGKVVMICKPLSEKAVASKQVRFISKYNLNKSRYVPPQVAVAAPVNVAPVQTERRPFNPPRISERSSPERTKSTYEKRTPAFRK